MAPRERQRKRIKVVRSGDYTSESKVLGQVAVPPFKTGISPSLQKATKTLYSNRCKKASHRK